MRSYRRSDFGYHSAQRGITRSRRSGALDMRRGSRPATIQREKQEAAFMAYLFAQARRVL